MATFGQLFEAFGLLSFQDLVTLATTPTQVFASHDDDLMTQRIIQKCFRDNRFHALRRERR